MNTTLAERISDLIEEKGCTVSELANAAGVKPPSVSDWLNGKTKTLKSATALRVARFFGVNILWLTEGTGPRKSSRELAPVSPGDDRYAIRRVLFKLSAGVSGYEIEYENGQSEPIFMAKRWFDQNHYRADKLIALHIKGRSMEPSLYDGDLVVVNMEDVRLVDGEVFAFNYDGELVIKRLKKESGNWYLSSDNPDKARFGDRICQQGCYAIGRVVYKQSEHI